VRALKLNGGAAADDLGQENLEALGAGVANLVQHLENLHRYGLSVVVALNRFPTDTKAELDFVARRCAELGVQSAITEVFARGADGGLELAEKVVELCRRPASLSTVYQPEDSLADKIAAVATRIYRADGVEWAPAARKQLDRFSELGYGRLPVCIAKTQYSFSDDPTRLGAPRDFSLTVREVRLDAGAGFVVALTGDIMTMPGLPRRPAAWGMDISDDGTIIGLS
jgi:formate--tetrahydrofolate ligase